MLNYDTLSQPATDHGLLRTGLFIGIAGGLAEIVVVWLYSAISGGDATAVARHVSSAVGLDGKSALVGVIVHMSLACVLGITLCAALQLLVKLSDRNAAIFSFMVGSLAIIWVINFFVVLPMLSPSFVHLLPYVVTLVSKLAFGFSAAVAWCALAHKPLWQLKRPAKLIRNDLDDPFWACAAHLPEGIIRETE